MHANHPQAGRNDARQMHAHTPVTSKPDMHSRHDAQDGATILEYVCVAALVSIAAVLALSNIGKQPATMLAPAISTLEGSSP